MNDRENEVADSLEEHLRRQRLRRKPESQVPPDANVTASMAQGLPAELSEPTRGRPCEALADEIRRLRDEANDLQALHDALPRTLPFPALHALRRLLEKNRHAT